MAPSDTLLQEMLDEFELRKLVHSYCRTVDRGDFAQLRSLYHEDALDDHGAFSAVRGVFIYVAYFVAAATAEL